MVKQASDKVLAIQRVLVLKTFLTSTIVSCLNITSICMDTAPIPSLLLPKIKSSLYNFQLNR